MPNIVLRQHDMRFAISSMVMSVELKSEITRRTVSSGKLRPETPIQMFSAEALPS